MTDALFNNAANGMRRIKRIHFIGIGAAGPIWAGASPLIGLGVRHA